MKLLAFCLIWMLFIRCVFSQPTNLPDKLYGVTIEDVTANFNQTLRSLQAFDKKPVSRVVFDNDLSAKKYSKYVKKIHSLSYVMGEIEDSDDMKNLTVKAYKNRVREFVDKLNDDVDLWEAGNEINGEWNGPEVIEKVLYALDYIKEKNNKTAVTFYYNKDCYDKPENEMFTWINNNITKEMSSKIDYVFVSYYEDDCNGQTPNWQTVFDSLHTIFPDSKLGIGECGTKKPGQKAEFMNRYYCMNITTPNYIGGYFWWYFKDDCVPGSKPLWKVLNDCMLK